MANRSVEVALKGRHGDYNSSTIVSTKLTKGLANEVQQVDQNLKKIPADSAKAAAAMKLLGAATDQAHTKLDLLVKGSAQLQTLEKRAMAARARVRELAIEFNRTGNAGVAAQLKAAQAEEKQLSKMAVLFSKQLGQKSGLLAAASEAGTIFGQGFGKAVLMTAPIWAPSLAAILIGSLAAAGGLIASTLPLAGIATGIFAQRNNPALAKPAARAGSSLGEDIKYATAPLAGPAGQAITGLAASLSNSIRATRGDFESLIPYLRMFAGYLGVAAEEFMPKFGEALRNAEPVFAVLAKDMPVLASAAGDFFLQISKGAKGGAEALDMFLGILAAFIRGLGYTIRGMENAFDAITQFLDGALGLLIDVNKALHLPVGPLDDIQKRVQQLGKDWETAKGSAWAFAGSVDDTNDSLSAQEAWLRKTVDQLNNYYDAQMTNINANIAHEQAIDDLTESLKENGRNWDINGQKGRDNTSALLRVIQTAHDQYVNNLKTMDPSKAADIYNKALKELAKQAGITMAQLKLITGTDWMINVRFHIEGSLGRFQGGIGNVYRHGGIQAADQGAIVPESRGPLVKFVEHGTGGEGFVPRKGITHARAGALLGEMASWHGYGLTDGNQWRGGGGGGGMPAVNLTVNMVDTDGRTLRKILIRDALNSNVPQSAIRVAYPG